MNNEVLDILKSMQGDMKSMQDDMKSMQGDIKSIQSDIKLMKGNMKSMEDEMKSMQGEIAGIKGTQDEHTQILRALEHKTDVISAEQENLKHEVIQIKGEVQGIRKDLSNVELITASNWSDIAKLKAIK